MKFKLIFAFLLLTGFTAIAEETEQIEPVMLQVKMSETCFYHSQQSQKEGKLVGWACDQKDESQKFSLNKAGGNWLQLKHIQSGLCAEVKNGSNRHHVGIQLTPCDNEDHQLWKKNPIDNEWFTLSSKHSQGCLDLDHGVSRNGNRFIWQRCLKKSNKAWFDKQAFKITKNSK